jgi:hypothetical protein
VSTIIAEMRAPDMRPYLMIVFFMEESLNRGIGALSSRILAISLPFPHHPNE